MQCILASNQCTCKIRTHDHVSSLFLLMTLNDLYHHLWEERWRLGFDRRKEGGGGRWREVTASQTNIPSTSSNHITCHMTQEGLEEREGGEGDHSKYTISQDTRYRILHRTPNTTHHTLPYTHEHYSSSVCDHHTYIECGYHHLNNCTI